MKRNVILLLTLSFVAALATARWCMSSGIGVSPDSVLYLSAAESVRAGHGLRPIAFHYTPRIAAGSPLTIFPPTYPLLLALTGSLISNQLDAAKWLHSILFASSVLLIGMTAYLSTGKSALATLSAMLLFQSTPSMLEIQTMAWSEPPFILFSLAAFLLLGLQITKPNYLLLAGSALSASLALTTRYVGVTLLPPMIITILFLENRPRRRRIWDCVIVLAIATLPLAAWLIRNILTTDSATNRSIGFHPVGISDIHDLVGALLVFWVPFLDSQYLKMVLFIIFAVVTGSGLVLALKKSTADVESARMNTSTQMLSAVFIITFLVFLIANNSLVNPPVELSNRVVSPVYVFGIILIVSIVYGLSNLWNRKTLQWGVLLLLFIPIGVNSVYAFSFAIRRHDDGSGYTSRWWTDSQSIAYIRTLPEAKTIYSNGIDAIYLLTKRETVRIPAKVDRVSGKNNPDFERDIDALRNDLVQNRAIVVYLDKIGWRWYLPSKEELEKVFRFPVLVRFDDGVVYGIR